MKARYNPLNNRERRLAKDHIKTHVAELVDIRGLLITYRTIAMVCLSLHEIHGFGKKRLSRLIYQLGAESAEHQDWIKDGVGDDILFKRLRKIGLGTLAEQIEAEQKRVDDIYATL